MLKPKSSNEQNNSTFEYYVLSLEAATVHAHEHAYKYIMHAQARGGPPSALHNCEYFDPLCAQFHSDNQFASTFSHSSPEIEID